MTVARGALIGSGAGIPTAFATDFVAGSVGNALEQKITKGRVDLGESLISGAGLPGNARRDPRGKCGSPDPFDLAETLGDRRRSQGGVRHGGGGRSRTGESGGFSLGGFLKDVAIGGIVGGLGSAAFYGAGRAVDALGEHLAGSGSGAESTELVIYYPDNNGVLLGTERKVYLLPGDKIDRYGSLRGKYFSPTGTPLKMRALPYNADITEYRQFEVVKPFEVEKSVVKPWFGKIGLGIQYRSDIKAEVLIKRGIIKKVGGN